MSHSSLVHRRDGQISTSNLPHFCGLKPYIWRLICDVVGFWTWYAGGFQSGGGLCTQNAALVSQQPWVHGVQTACLPHTLYTAAKWTHKTQLGHDLACRWLSACLWPIWKLTAGALSEKPFTYADYTQEVCTHPAVQQPGHYLPHSCLALTLASAWCIVNSGRTQWILSHNEEGNCAAHRAEEAAHTAAGYYCAASMILKSLHDTQLTAADNAHVCMQTSVMHTHQPCSLSLLAQKASC